MGKIKDLKRRRRKMGENDSLKNSGCEETGSRYLYSLYENGQDLLNMLYVPTVVDRGLTRILCLAVCLRP